MKKLPIIRITFLAALALSAQLWAQQMTIDQLPAAVRQTANTETKNGPLTKAQRIMKDGRPIYDITFQQPNGAQKNIYLEENGTYVQAGTGPAAASSRGGTINRQVSLSEVPEAVRREINTEAANGPVKRIQERPYNGREVYEVAMQKRDGSEKLIYLNPDGSYVQDPPAAASTAVGGAAAVGTQTGNNRSSLAGGPLPGAAQVTLAEVPATVQNSIHTQLGNIALEQVQKGMINGRVVYQALYRSNGQLMQIRLGENGRVLQSPIIVNQ